MLYRLTLADGSMRGNGTAPAGSGGEMKRRCDRLRSRGVAAGRSCGGQRTAQSGAG
jgi:hypothetical protein